MSQRTERVAESLLREIGRIFREELENPSIGFVTFLRVEVTADLRNAKVIYSVMGTEAEKKTTDIEIRNSAKYIKKLVNDRLGLRYAVDLQFIRETGIEHSFRVDEILEQIRRDREEKEKNEAPGP